MYLRANPVLPGNFWSSGTAHSPDNFDCTRAALYEKENEYFFLFNLIKTKVHSTERVNRIWIW